MSVGGIRWIARERRRPVSDELVGWLARSSRVDERDASWGERTCRRAGLGFRRRSGPEARRGRSPRTASVPYLRARDNGLTAAAPRRTPRTPSHPAGATCPR